MADSSPQHSRDWLSCRCDDATDLDDEHDRNAKYLESAIRKQDCIPSAMSRGHTSLADKASALLYMWLVMLGSFNVLLAFCASIFALISDMGTELGLSDFRMVTFKDLLPAWLLPEPEDAQALDFEDDVAAAPSRPQRPAGADSH